MRTPVVEVDTSLYRPIGAALPVTVSLPIVQVSQLKRENGLRAPAERGDRPGLREIGRARLHGESQAGFSG